jgi:hypothetical protein
MNIKRLSIMRRFASKFSIKTLLLVVASLAIAIGWVAPMWRASIREQRILTRIGRVGTVKGWGRYGRDHRLPYSLTLAPNLTMPRSSDLIALQNINRLKLVGRQANDEWLSRLKTEHVKQLRFLDLSCTSITDSGLGRLPQIPNLKSLDLNSSSISNVGMEMCKHMPNLESLFLDDTSVDDVGIEAIVESFPNLRTLSISGTKVTDNGLDTLTKLRFLGAVGAYNTAVTAEGAERLESHFKEANVNIRIDHGAWPLK